MHEDIKVARRCFLLVNINQCSTSVPKTPYISGEKKTVAIKNEANLVELDSRFNKIEMKEYTKKDLLYPEILRPIHDGNFERVHFCEDPSKNFKLPSEITVA